jgi:hypothetical protein
MDVDPVHPCLICQEEEDDANVAGVAPGTCSACGQRICGKCWPVLMASAHANKCPKCRVPAAAPNEENALRVQWLVRDREPGGHKSHAQCQLGSMYA